MTVRIIASAVIAALLLGGTAVATPQSAPPATAPPVVNTDPAPDVTATPQVLTREEAQQIALAHAGFAAEEVTKLRTEQDRDRGIAHWDVEFTQGDWEYDYEIHMETGAILDWDKEYDPPKQPPKPPVAEPPATQPPATEPPATQPPAAEPKRLTREEALVIALAHAGLTEEQVRELEAELDREHGILVWEVDFELGNWEYEYEIHAQTGEILHSEKELDD